MPRTAAKAMGDVRHAIIRKIRAMKRRYNPNEWPLEVLVELERWISTMDERALKRKGGVTHPWRPLRKIAGTGLKKKAKG